MAQKGIREYHAKKMLAKQIESISNESISYQAKVALVTPGISRDDLIQDNPWLIDVPLVVKPDQLFGKRGKNGLIFIGPELKGASIDDAWDWISQRMEQTIQLNSGIEGVLTHFLIEPYIVHNQEYYIAIHTEATDDIIEFSCYGGMDVEDHPDTIEKATVLIDDLLSDETLEVLLKDVRKDDKIVLGTFFNTLLTFVRKNHVASIELNPFSVKGREVILLDAVTRLDDTAQFLCAEFWGPIEFPAPFGKASGPEEKYISYLDGKTGASLKLTLLNEKGKIWTMVAGGGSSVIYADTVVDLGMGAELSNYGEYSGNPTAEDTCEYAKTLLELMARNNGKVLIIGGGIANFTDVAKTFTGIIRALTDFADMIKEKRIKIFVRRGGPNYKKGLELIRHTAEKLGIDLEAYGPETHMTRIVKLAIERI